jgi:AcrR family transcriptional regulator
MKSNNSFSERPDMDQPARRKPRADGVRSRQAILYAAANLATTRGLEALSLGELAQHIGMSKSGLFAHFKSKEELELATIEAATEVFEREVVLPATKSAAGLDRVHALAEAFLGHLERRVFPGGCFFVAVSVQLAAQPGRARARVLAVQHQWQQQFVDALRLAVDQGELPAGLDIDQTVFEITAMLLRANFKWVLSGDAAALDQAREGIRHVLGRAPDRPKRARASRRRT